MSFDSEGNDDSVGYEDSRSYRTEATASSGEDEIDRSPSGRRPRRRRERASRNRSPESRRGRTDAEPTEEETGESSEDPLLADESDEENQDGQAPQADIEAITCSECEGAAHACNGLLRECLFLGLGALFFVVGLGLVYMQNIPEQKGGRCWAQMHDWVFRSNPCKFETPDTEDEVEEEVDYSVTQCCDRECASISGASAIIEACSAVAEPKFAVILTAIVLVIGLVLLIFGGTLLGNKINRHGVKNVFSPTCRNVTAVMTLLIGLTVLALGVAMFVWPFATNECTPFGSTSEFTVRNGYLCCDKCANEDECECRSYESVRWVKHTLLPVGSVLMGLGAALVGMFGFWLWWRRRLYERRLHTNVVLIGLPGAGKTSLLNRFAQISDSRRDDRDDVSYAEALPTYGTQTLTLKQWSAGAEHQHVAPTEPRTMTFFDIGGKTEWAAVALDLPPRVNAIAFVVDGRDHGTLHTSGRLLAALLSHRPLANAALCIFVNKHDGYVHDAITTAWLTDQWDLYTLRGRRWNILQCSAFEDDDIGVHKGLSWIMAKTQQPSQPWFAQQ